MASLNHLDVESCRDDFEVMKIDTSEVVK